MTNEELQASRERCDKATYGPWIYTTNSQSLVDGIWIKDTMTKNGGVPIARVNAMTYKDAEFTAHARTDLPKALDEIEALQTDCKNIANWNKRLRDEIDELIETCAKRNNSIVYLESLLQQRDAKIERLRGTLQWYAQESVYEVSPMSGSTFVSMDGGRRARKALAGDSHDR